MKSILIAAVLLVTLLTFYSALWLKSEDIEADIRTRVTEDLAAADAKDIEIDVDGRHVTLSGIVYDAATETAYLDTADATYGSLGPIDGLTFQNGGGFLKAVKSPEGITLTGAVPSDATRAALLQTAADSTESDVVDAMTVGAAAGSWTDEANFGLAQLSKLEQGTLSVAPDSYTLSGVTNGDALALNASLAERAGWQAFVSAPRITTGLSEKLDTANGKISGLESNVVALEGLLAERDGVISTLTGERDTLSTALANMTDERDGAIAARDASTADVIAQRDALANNVEGLTAARDVLSQTVTSLGTERETLAQSIAALTGERDTAVADLEALRGSLDATQSSTAALNEELSEVQGQLAQRDTTIDGLNTQVADLTEQLETQTASLNSGQQADADLRAQISTQAGTIEELTADLRETGNTVSRLEGELAATTTQIATLTDQVADRDVTIDELRNAPATLVAANADTSAGVTEIAAQCSARAGDVLENTQINFASGTANIRNNSVEVLERLTGIALACADSGLAVEIGGHTDSQGSDADNQNLSERRAQAIAQFMMDRGVPESTLSPVGFGEANPIGDNATPEGRQQNRRISFEWQAR